ncbi:MAG: hypothetical protein JXA82_18820 [Sedimentisphaerales bacterium]|nr:hypothetical protein [Sedimentisphaerales bacterium]
MSRARLLFMVFYLTAILIGTVYLRTAPRRLFNRYREAKVQQKRLVEHLRKRQLELEYQVSPTSVAEHLPEKKPNQTVH